MFVRSLTAPLIRPSGTFSRGGEKAIEPRALQSALLLPSVGEGGVKRRMRGDLSHPPDHTKHRL